MNTHNLVGFAASKGRPHSADSPAAPRALPITFESHLLGSSTGYDENRDTLVIRCVPPSFATS
jgi:hypothetical protein